MLIQHCPLLGTIHISKGDQIELLLTPSICPHSISMPLPPGSLPDFFGGSLPSAPPITDCVVPAYFLVYFHELHENLCLIYHGILHHPAHGLIQRNAYEVGGVIIVIIVVIIVINIISPILQMRKPRLLPKVT